MNFFAKIGIGWTIVLVLCLIFLIWLIVTYVTIRLNYKPLFDWWANNRGKKYDNKLNLFTLAVANYSPLMYYISKSMSSPLNQLEVPQIRFVLGQLLPYLTYVIGGVQYGLLTPKSLCETVLLSSSDNDEAFNYWFSTSDRSESIKRSYTSVKVTNGVPSGMSWYKYTASNIGVYPGNFSDWIGMILEWLGPDWVMEEDDDQILHPRYTKEDNSHSYDYWFNTDPTKGGRPDNFLARMGIFPDAPFVLYFCSNKYSTEGMKIDAEAFNNLLGGSGGVNAGGWVGFLNGLGGSNYNLDQYINLIRTITDYKLPPTPPPCKQPDTMAGVSAGVGAGMGIAGVGLIGLGMGPPGWALAGVCALAGLFVGVTTGLNAGKGTCN